jgi:hypothetical protein
MDIDAFAYDVRRSDLITALSADVNKAFYCCDKTLKTHIDQHAPLEMMCIRIRSSARSYDMKRTKTTTQVAIPSIAHRRSFINVARTVQYCTAYVLD